MPLKEYHRKRRFDVTPEPSGAKAQPGRRGAALRYVIQKHRASHLHYDFRLEWNGVLLSWAVPKGPSLDASVRRLAVATDNHPIAYADFEGVIPEGEHGGGAVMIWDRGSWTPEAADVDEALRKGDLKFTLRGRKLKGSWVLLRTRGFGGGAKSVSWILMKLEDAFAGEEDVTETHPLSAVSKRNLAQIAAKEDASPAPRGKSKKPPGKKA